MPKIFRKVSAIALFWMIFFFVFAYAQDIVIPKDNSRDTSDLLNSYVTPYTNATRCSAFENLPADTVDVALIGSSTVFCGVNPIEMYEQQGIAAHDFAVGAMTGGLTAYMTSIVFETQHPKIVALDATRLYTDYVNQSVNYIVPMTRLSVGKIKLALQSGSLTSAVEYLVPLLMCHQNWTATDADDFRFSFASREDPLLGMVGMIKPGSDAQTLYESFSKPAMSYAKYVPDVHPTLTETAMQQLVEFRDTCMSMDAQPILIVCPSVFSNQNTRFLLQLEDYAAAQGIPMMNFNIHREGLTLTVDDFADDHHLTVTGMSKFSKVLAEYLKSHFDLPDRRGQDGYQRYDNSVALYHKILQELAVRKGES